MDCNYEDPESVVRCFIAEMNRWETESHVARRAVRQSDNPASYQAPVTAAMNRIFSAYCTPKPRPHGRQSSFQNPPEYNPEHETVLSSVIRGPSASVRTERDSVFGGLFRYALKRIDNRWLIDTLKRCGDDDSESRAIL